MTIESPISILVNNELTLKNIDTVGYKHVGNILLIEIKSKLFNKLNLTDIFDFFCKFYEYKNITYRVIKYFGGETLVLVFSF